MKIVRRPSAFTLVELLVVIAILGILAALTVPALKNLGKANVQTSASRQLLDGVNRARQLAINDHTTVYMVFLSTNFWLTGGTWLNSLNFNEANALTNLMDKQLSGYNYIAYGALGDQPGRHQWHYLDAWQTLPQGYIIPGWKFTPVNPGQPFAFNDPVSGNGFSIFPFDYTNTIPFPMADSNALVLASPPNNPPNNPVLPYIAFNYLGQLVSSANDRDSAGGGVDIPIAQGNVAYPLDPQTKIPQVVTTPLGGNAVAESPVGNSTNITYNVVHIDPLTGRATLEYHKVQ
ncbi:MAG TPA: type II secretion system protein [Candidatus Acidoferrum sp.]|nr:type II secretion system protein [Candidatus Acidoferrum sp.]